MKEIKIVSVKEITTKDGKRFNAFKTVTKTGKLMDLKFTRDVRTIPDRPCIIVTDNYNVDTSKLYPCVWIRNVIETREIPKSTEIDDIL